MERCHKKPEYIPEKIIAIQRQLGCRVTRPLSDIIGGFPADSIDETSKEYPFL